MLAVRTRSRVAADGTVTVPVGTEDAGVEVDVTIVPTTGKPAAQMTQDEWVEFLRSTAGSIPDLERPTQGEFQTREPLE